MNFKKLLALLVAMAMILCCFAACGSNDEDDDEEDVEQNEKNDDGEDNGEAKIDLGFGNDDEDDDEEEDVEEDEEDEDADKDDEDEDELVDAVVNTDREWQLGGEWSVQVFVSDYVAYNMPGSTSLDMEECYAQFYLTLKFDGENKKVTVSTDYDEVYNACEEYKEAYRTYLEELGYDSESISETVGDAFYDLAENVHFSGKYSYAYDGSTLTWGTSGAKFNVDYYSDTFEISLLEEGSGTVGVLLAYLGDTVAYKN